ncbi:MAG TPA: shikimate kinase [Candidatus Thermoplasmatota archaeon]|nr:shikimate kinase [Candidatus Thermoplasmatota archaeon]
MLSNAVLGLGRARTFGAVSVVNAIATGKGASLGVDLPVDASVEVRRDGHIVIDVRRTWQGAQEGTASMPTALVRAAVLGTLEWAGRAELGAWVVTESRIPPSRGLKSSSAVANAVVLATLEALQMVGEARDEDVLGLGVAAARAAGVTLTGAYDDACASLLGGLCVTDNAAMQLVKRTDVRPDLVAVVHVPDREIRKADVAKLPYASIAPAAQAAWDAALAGDFERALTENGRAYAGLLGVDESPARAALEAGARCAGLSGTGPATAALAEPAAAKAVAKALSRFAGVVLETRVRNEPGGVVRRSS